MIQLFEIINVYTKFLLTGIKPKRKVLKEGEEMKEEEDLYITYD